MTHSEARCLNSEISDVPIPNVSTWRCFWRLACGGSLVDFSVVWLFSLVSWLILTVWLLVIDWSCCQRSAALYRASGNRYFPFTHGPPNLSTPDPNSLILHPSSPNSRLLQHFLAAPLLREFAAYLVSGQPSVAAVAKICGELFNSSQ